MSKSMMTISGRLLWTLAPSNNPMERVTAKNRQSGQVIYDKSGQPVQQTTFSLAVPKGSPQLDQLKQLQQVEILKIYPSGQVPKNFAHKMVDGDIDVDDKGRPYSQREGHAGHMVIAFNARFPVNWYQYDGANYQEISSGVKVGDYVDVNFTIAAHGPSNNGGAPGFYVEPKAVLFKGVGDAIEKKVQTADPHKAFGGGQGFGQQQVAPAQQFQQQQPMQPNQQFQQPQWQPQATPNQAPQGQPMGNGFAPNAGQNYQQQTQSVGQTSAASASPSNQQPQWQQQVQGQPVQPHYGGLPPQFQKQ